MVSTPMTSGRSTASTPYDVIYSTPTKSLFRNEENSYRGSEARASAKERFIKRSRVGASPLQNSCSDNRSECGVSDYLSWKHVRLERDRSADSEVGSEANSCAESSVVSVSQMRGWLNDFGKQNKAHYDKMNQIGKHPEGVSLSKPLRTKTPHSSKQAAMVVVKNLTSTQDGTRGPAKTPVRFKPRYNKREVEATNDGYASVQKLSAWLADDPTSTKKVTHLRKGINVISKSRMFEKDMADVIIEENDIQKGSVVEKKRTFQTQNKGDGEAEQENDWDNSSCVDDKKKWLQGAFRRESRAFDEQSDVSVMSVTDKKKWLQNAFSKTEGNKQKSTNSRVDLKPESKGLSQAVSTHELTRDHRDETSEAEGKKAEGIIFATPSAESRDQLPSCTSVTKHPKKQEERMDHAQVDGYPSDKKPSNPDMTHHEAFGFEAARQLLVKRSVRNGNAVSVLSKVQMRKQKFEKLEKERARGCGPMGLLKPSWDLAEPSEGRPSMSYTKSYVEDIAPKRSFEELP